MDAWRDEPKIVESFSEKQKQFKEKLREDFEMK